MASLLRQISEVQPLDVEFEASLQEKDCQKGCQQKIQMNHDRSENLHPQCIQSTTTLQAAALYKCIDTIVQGNSKGNDRDLNAIPWKSDRPTLIYRHAKDIL